MDDLVLQTVPLGDRWPTVDPFLFCAHHRDDYPTGSDDLGPSTSLAGRELGMDFAGVDGWNMYHGRRVPGFPQHPHRGFETITFVRRGIVDHSDSLGAAARFGRGDVQWMTAGSGIVHSEMFPLLDRNGPNPLHLFQIWLNLPAADKLVDPYFTMFWAGDIPARVSDGAEVTVIAGALDGHVPPTPPPDSWAGREESDVALWHVALEAGATVELPPARRPDSLRTVYLFEGSDLLVGATPLEADTGAVVRPDLSLQLTARGGPVECLLMQGRPLQEPVAQYGPFVMNHDHEIREAVLAYQRTEFGGWPWPTDDPVHPTDQERFALHADGRVEAGR